MFKPRNDEAGDTLIEVILAVVIIGLVSSALFTAFATGTTASNRVRDLTTVDAVLRNAAEATKNAVRVDCLDGGTYSVHYEAPAGFTSPADVTNAACPPVAGPVTTPSNSGQTQTVLLTARAPNGAPKSLTVVVRSP